ncbi:MAG: hypothetical protein LQ346_002038 [Caloplaca aetnensis]|nr:MAG: hypothetical protein LQ346_002038 [Caloplaca aetnensis]
MATVAIARPRRALGEISSSRSNKHAMLKHLQVVEAQEKAAREKESSSGFEVPSGKFNFTSTIKRSFDAYDNDEDQENIDPRIQHASGKRAKASDGQAVKPRQASHYTLTTVKKPVVPESTKIARTTLGVKPRPEKPAAKVDVGPDSTKVKYLGIAARHRQAGKRVVHVGPYIRGGHVPASTPFSLTGSTQDVSMPRLGKKTRKAWAFNILEDSPEDELTNLMEHSAHTLDISDDENRGKFRDDSDKENIPPPGCAAPAGGRRDMMTDEARTPLGKLAATDYYASGVDASSVINAPQEELPALEPVTLEFGSIDGEVHKDVHAKLSNIEVELVNKGEDSSAGTADNTAYDKSNTA